MSRLLVAVALSSVAAASAPVGAQTSEFYKGRVVEVIIGFGSGGGNDAYGRLLATHIGKHLPGSPNVIAKNLPGAGSFIAANQIFSVSPRDGTVIGLASPTIPLDEKIGTEGVRFKSAQFGWIGRIDSQIDVLFTRNDSPVRSVQQARDIEATLSSTGAGSASSIYPAVLNNVIGTRFKIILGYKGSADSMLAVERGEADGHSTAWNTLRNSKPEWLSEKKINLLVQFSTSRHPEMADVPTALEAANSDEDKRVLSAIMSASDIGTAFFTTPGVQDDRLTALRRAFDSTVKDPAFLADAGKIKFSVGPFTGEKVQELVAEVDKLDPQLIERIKKAFVIPQAK